MGLTGRARHHNSGRQPGSRPAQVLEKAYLESKLAQCPDSGWPPRAALLAHSAAAERRAAAVPGRHGRGLCAGPGSRPAAAARPRPDCGDARAHRAVLRDCRCPGPAGAGPGRRRPGRPSCRASFPAISRRCAAAVIRLGEFIDRQDLVEELSVQGLGRASSRSARWALPAPPSQQCAAVEPGRAQPRLAACSSPRSSPSICCATGIGWWRRSRPCAAAGEPRPPAGGARSTRCWPASCAARAWSACSWPASMRLGLPLVGPAAWRRHRPAHRPVLVHPLCRHVDRRGRRADRCSVPVRAALPRAAGRRRVRARPVHRGQLPDTRAWSAGASACTRSG